MRWSMAYSYVPLLPARFYLNVLPVAVLPNVLVNVRPADMDGTTPEDQRLPQQPVVITR